MEEDLEPENFFTDFLNSNENPVICYGNKGMRKYFVVEEVRNGIICGRPLILGPREKILKNKVTLDENLRLSNFYKINSL